ncbi:MAG: nitroreductase family protein [Deltaproteobacteria bacterium]|nr:nitroreductase family protein [Deltaproteobacteria bacterium]
MDYDALMSLITSRRSTRRYKRDPVPLDMVMQVLEAGRWAPSGDNSQPWDFVVVRDEDKRKQVMEILIESGRQCREACPRFTFIRPEKLEAATTLIFVCADRRFLAAYPRSADDHELADMYEENAERILIESVTFSIALINLAAVSLGLGTVFFSGPGEQMTSEKLKAVLHVPEPLQILCCLPLGYPEEGPQSSFVQGDRCPRPLESMVHMDEFDRQKWRNQDVIDKHMLIGKKAWAHFYRTGNMEE